MAIRIICQLRLRCCSFFTDKTPI